MNTTLLNTSFLVGTTLTLADLIVFGALYPTVSALAPAELTYLCNLTRWMDYVYMTSGAPGLFKALNFRKPAFAPPAELFAAPALSAKKEDKKDAKEGGKADAKKPVEQKAAETKPEPEKATPAEPAAGGEAKKEKKEKKVRELPTKKEDTAVCVSLLDIRVGTIVKCEKHPNADSLYVEEIDIGEEAPRQIVSGLVKFIPLERMQGARVLVLCNVKPGDRKSVV